MRTIYQLIKEYCLPFTLACIWTLINVYKKEFSALSFVSVDLVNIFGASFILLSWFSEKYFRIAGQAEVENSLDEIEKRTNEILERVENRANQVIDGLENRTALIFSQVSGGNSFCYANLSQNYLGEKRLTITHQGDYPLYDLTLRVVDLDKFKEQSANPDCAHKYEKIFSVGTMLPKQLSNLCNFNFSELQTSMSLNIFFSARNGMFHEQLRLKKVNNEWVSAFKVDREKTILESISDSYPKNDQGGIDW